MDMVFECKGDARLITEWSAEFENLYIEKDLQRKPEELWVATMGHCSDMGEAIRRTHYKELLKAAAHVFCWMCSYVNRCKRASRDPIFKIGAHLSEIVGFKYPQRCGHCEQTECVCRHVELDKKKDKAAKYKDLLEVWRDQKFDGYNINRWLKMFWKIYSGQIHLLTMESIGFHFLEEAGEAAKANRKLLQLRGLIGEGIDGVDEKLFEKITTIEGVVDEYYESASKLKDAEGVKDKSIDSSVDFEKLIDYASKDPLQIKARVVDAKMGQFIELADTFSWYCAVLIKLNEILSNAGVDTKEYNIEGVLQTEYGEKGMVLKCPTCNKTKCECLFFYCKEREVNSGNRSFKKK